MKNTNVSPQTKKKLYRKRKIKSQNNNYQKLNLKFKANSKVYRLASTKTC